MADRRMFSRRITSSARFLKMGEGAQLLYFHLCLAADDDGVVEAYSVRQMTGAKEDSYVNLVGRNLITVLDQENEIIYINDWLEHNKLRADRITPSVHRGLLQAAVAGAEVITPKQRADRAPKVIEIEAIQVQDDPGTVEGRPTDDHGTSQGQQRDSSGTSQGRPTDDHGTATGPHRLGKDRLGKDKTVKDSTDKDKEQNKTDGAGAPSPRGFMRPSIQEIKDYCQEKGYKHVDAEYFWNYYENIGWKVGKYKMKSWQLAVANWDKRHKRFQEEKDAKAETVSHTEEETADKWWGEFQ